MPPQPPPNQLSLALLRAYATGELPATSVRRLAAAAREDGWGDGSDLAERIATAGNSGQLPGNISRDVLKATALAGLLSSGSSPYEVAIPGETKPAKIMLPHEVLCHAVAKSGGMEPWTLNQQELQEGRLGRLLRNWANHDDVQYTGPLDDVGIVGLHMDGVQYTTSNRAGGARSVVVCSINVVSAKTPKLKNQRFPIFVLRKARLCGCGCQGYHTYQALLDVVAWSFRCLLEGQAPGARHDGSPFGAESENAQRFPRGAALPKFALLQIRSDWEQIVYTFRFRSFSSETFCWMRQAQKHGLMDFKNFSDDAPHRGTQISHEDYVMDCAVSGNQPSFLFRSPGLLLPHIAVDAMHAGDLGSFQDRQLVRIVLFPT